MRRLPALVLLAALTVRVEALELLEPAGAAALTHASAPRVIALWSLDCTYCDGNLRRLAALARERSFELVTVATDAPERRAEVEARLAALELHDGTAWIYGESSPERLNYRIDPDWGGELPRTIVVGAGEALQISGALTPAQIDNLRRLLPPQ